MQEKSIKTNVIMIYYYFIIFIIVVVIVISIITSGRSFCIWGNVLVLFCALVLIWFRTADWN